MWTLTDVCKWFWKCRKCHDSISTCDHSSYRVRGAVVSMEYRTNGLDCRTYCAAIVCRCHVLHLLLASWLLPVPWPCHWQAQLHLHGDCASQSGCVEFSFENLVPEIVCVMLHWKETLWSLKIHQSGLRREKLENLKKSQQKLCNEIEDWNGKMS